MVAFLFAQLPSLLRFTEPFLFVRAEDRGRGTGKSSRSSIHRFSLPPVSDGLREYTRKSGDVSDGMFAAIEYIRLNLG